MDNQMEDSGHPMTRTPAVMEIELKRCPFCGDSMEAALGLIRHIDPTAACPIRQQSWPVETLAAWNHRTPAEPLADGEMIEIVARALCELDIRTKRRFDTGPNELEKILPAAVNYAWRSYIMQAEAAIAAMQEMGDAPRDEQIEQSNLES